MKPHRVQLSRRKGWRKPANTVVVSRPTLFGNPFWKGYGCRMSAAWQYEVALTFELIRLRLGLPARDAGFRRMAERLPELRGKNLACWCPADLPDCYCHAGALLRLANEEVVAS